MRIKDGLPVAMSRTLWRGIVSIGASASFPPNVCLKRECWRSFACQQNGASTQLGGLTVPRRSCSIWMVRKLIHTLSLDETVEHTLSFGRRYSSSVKVS